MASPSTNPSSCDSSTTFPPISLCSNPPSSNQQYTSWLNCSSPVTANSAPVNDPNLPEPAVPKIWLTTVMANQAAEDLEKGKAKNITEWYEQYKKGLAEEEKRRAEQVQNAVYCEKKRNDGQGDQIGSKRKLDSNDEVTCAKNRKTDGSVDEALVYETIGEVKNSFNPLRQMERMANSSEFQPSNKISEVVAENKRERSSKSTIDAVPSVPMQNGIPMPNNGLSTSSPYPPLQPHFPHPGPPEIMLTQPGMQAMPNIPPGFRMPNNPQLAMHPQIRQYQMHAWQMHRMMVARAAHAGQMPPFPFMPPPPHAFLMPGPFSGPNPELRNLQFSSGPMTAPTAPMSQMTPPFASPMFPPSFFHAPPSAHRSPAMTPSDYTSVQPHPTPLFSFASDPSAQPSSLPQDSGMQPPF